MENGQRTKLCRRILEGFLEAGRSLCKHGRRCNGERQESNEIDRTAWQVAKTERTEPRNLGLNLLPSSGDQVMSQHAAMIPKLWLGDNADPCGNQVEGTERQTYHWQLMIFAIPGMGADETMYPGPWPALPGSAFINWPGYKGEKTLALVAKRLIAEHQIKDGDTVVGSSLGGMVGCEISKVVRLERLVLIGSAINKGEISALLSRLHPLADLAPFEFLRRAAAKAPFEVAQMFGRSEPAFTRAMCRAIFEWDGLGSGIRPLRIHGRKDLVIPLPREVDCVLPGGHLISMTHAEECVEFVRTKCLV